MANEFHANYKTGVTLFGAVRNLAGLVCIVATGVFEIWNDLNRDNYKIILTEATEGQDYVGSFPTTVKAEGRYLGQVFLASNNTITHFGCIDWSGTQEVFPPLRINVR